MQLVHYLVTVLLGPACLLALPSPLTDPYISDANWQTVIKNPFRLQDGARGPGNVTSFLVHSAVSDGLGRFVIRPHKFEDF